MTSASTFSDRPDADATLDPLIGESTDPTQLLPKRPFPALDATYLQHGKGHDNHEVMVVVMPDALRQVHHHAISNMRSELGGFLLGHAYQYEGQHHIRIEVALPALSDDHGPVHFTFGADSWSECHKRKDTLYPDLRIIGWYHTHPGLGVFYSSDDVVVHSAGFVLPWHVGLVVDPVRNDASFFGWVQGDLACLSGFYEQSGSTTSDSAVPWRYAHTNVRNFMSYELPALHAPVAQQNAESSLISPSEWGLLAATVGVLLFFFVAGWAALLERQVNQLQQMILTQAESDQELVIQSCPNPNLRILSPQPTAALSQGERVRFLGTADLPGAARYEVWVRPASSSSAWQRIGVSRFDKALGTLATWNTKDVSPGLYDVGITAVDRTNLLLPGLPPCQIQVMIAK